MQAQARSTASFPAFGVWLSGVVWCGRIWQQAWQDGLSTAAAVLATTGAPCCVCVSCFYRVRFLEPDCLLIKSNAESAAICC